MGAVTIGAFSLGAGFTSDAKVFFVLRAFAGMPFLFLQFDCIVVTSAAGIGAALTVPSGLSLIVEWFPEPEEQTRGLAMFGGFGGLGNG